MDLLETAATEIESLAIPEPQDATFATIGAIYEDGVTLIFDGQKEATEKHYKVNTSVSFAAGNRVKICKDSGTYVVEYVVGSPKPENDTVSGYPSKIKNNDIEGDGLSFGFTENGRFAIFSEASGGGKYIWNDYQKIPWASSIVTNTYYSQYLGNDYDIQFRSTASGSLQFKRVRDSSWTTIA